MTNMIEKSCTEFTEMLASGASVPGGGGASAMVGALGIALGSMVGNLTIGKKRYEHVQGDVKIILEKAKKLQGEFLMLVGKDAEVFEPLSKAYGMPRGTDEENINRDRVMEEALKLACSVPIEIMEKCMEAIELHHELAQKGTRLAISDVGVGVLFCKAALRGASLNVFINTKLMKNRGYALKVNDSITCMLDKGTDRANKVYNLVEGQIKSI